MTRPTDVLRQHVLPRLERVRPAGGGQFKASCPVRGHGKGNGDRNPSLSVGPGDSQPVVFKCQAGCDQEDVMNALTDLGVDWGLVSEGRSHTPDYGPDDWMPCVGGLKGEPRNPGHRKVAEYEYRDADGRVVLGVARCVQKDFAQFRPDPTSKSGRRWSITLPDGTKAGEGIPYRLPEILRGIQDERAIFVCEGEKDCDRLWSLGYPATCNAGGGTTTTDGKSKWTEKHAEWLAGADVIIVADRDATGRRWATRVVETLMPLARSIEVIQAAEGKDAADHLDAGLKIHQFVQVAEPIPAPPAPACPGCPGCENAGDR